MRSQALVNTSGPMANNMRANGKRTKCTGKELLYGGMASSMKVTSLMIKERVKELSSGRMEESMRASGKMESNTVLVFSLQKTIK